ncbi:MAG: hypothetical protein R2856_28425 [Caldilineaceae bacterium]
MDAIEDLRDYLLAEHNILIATGGGPLTGQIARIGHMGLAGTDAYVGRAGSGGARVLGAVRTCNGISIPS